MLKSRQGSYEETKKTAEGKKKQKDAVSERRTHSSRSRGSVHNNVSIQGQPAVEQTGDHDSIAFEEAIQKSVAATSKGNPEEDRLIERAIRASVVELQLASAEGDGDDAVQRAIQASISEASRARMEQGNTVSGQGDGTSDHDWRLEAALRQSMLENQQSVGGRSEDPHLGPDDPGVASDDDENVKMAIELSQASTAGNHESDENLQRAIEASRKAHEAHEQVLAKSRTEEEIVLDYVKKQSEAEAQYQKPKADVEASSSNPEEAELERAMKESLALHRTRS